MFPCQFLWLAFLYVVLRCFLSIACLLIAVWPYAAVFLAGQLDCMSALVLSAGTCQFVWKSSRAFASNCINACSSLLAAGHTIFAYLRSVIIYLFQTVYSQLVSYKLHAPGFRNIHLCCMHACQLTREGMMFATSFLMLLSSGQSWHGLSQVLLFIWTSLFQLHFPRQVCIYMHAVNSIWCTSCLRSCCLDQVTLTVCDVSGYFPRCAPVRVACILLHGYVVGSVLTPAPITWNILTGITLLRLGTSGDK